MRDSGEPAIPPLPMEEKGDEDRNKGKGETEVEIKGEERQR